MAGSNNKWLFCSTHTGHMETARDLFDEIREDLGIADDSADFNEIFEGSVSNDTFSVIDNVDFINGLDVRAYFISSPYSAL